MKLGWEVLIKGLVDLVMKVVLVFYSKGDLMTFREHLEQRMTFTKRFIDRVVKVLTPALEAYDLYAADPVKRIFERAKFQRYVHGHVSYITAQRYLWLVNSWNEAEGRRDIEWMTPKQIERELKFVKDKLHEAEMARKKKEFEEDVRAIMESDPERVVESDASKRDSDGGIDIGDWDDDMEGGTED